MLIRYLGQFKDDFVFSRFIFLFGSLSKYTTHVHYSLKQRFTYILRNKNVTLVKIV